MVSGCLKYHSRQPENGYVVNLNGFGKQSGTIEFQSLVEINAMSNRSLAAHMTINMNLRDTLFRSNLMHFIQQPRSITATATLGDGNQIINMNVPPANQIGFFTKPAYSNRVGFSCFKQSKQAIALRTLHIIHLLYKLVDVIKRGAQHAQCSKYTCRFFGQNFTHMAGWFFCFSIDCSAFLQQWIYCYL